MWKILYDGKKKDLINNLVKMWKESLTNVTCVIFKYAGDSTTQGSNGSLGFSGSM